MKKFQNTNIKVISKVSEYANCDAVDIAYDAIDYSRAESVKNGVQISRQIGKRRIIDRNRNAIAHEQVDYSQFKVTKLDAGQVVDNSKKEQDIESAAMDFLAELGINWSDDSEQEENNTEEQEITEQQAIENVSDNSEQEQQDFTDKMIDQLIQSNFNHVSYSDVRYSLWISDKIGSPTIEQYRTIYADSITAAIADAMSKLNEGCYTDYKSAKLYAPFDKIVAKFTNSNEWEVI